MKFSWLPLTLCGMAVAAPAIAHHSGAMFDREKTVTLSGVVKDYEYSNPHTWLNLVVLDPTGKEMIWGVEGSPPARMRSWGLTPSVIHPGDKVTVRMHPLKDGRNGGSFIDITLPNGQLIRTS